MELRDRESARGPWRRDSAGVPAPAQERPAIIDMHLHAWEGRWEAGAAPPNPITGRPSSALTGADLIPRTLEVMERLNVVLGLAGGGSAAVRRWVEHAPERIVGSLMFPVVLPGTTPPAFPLEEARAGLRAGRLGAPG